MKIPKKLKIGAHEIEVIYPHRFTERSDCYGLADTRHHKIFLEDKDGTGTYPESATAQTFLHEIVHFISKMATGNTILFEAEEKHDLFCEILFQVLRDNNLNFADKGK